MTEGRRGGFDQPQPRPYQEIPLSPVEEDRVKDRMRAFPAGIGAVVGLMRDPRSSLGQRFAIGLTSSIASSQEALVAAGTELAFARENRPHWIRKTPDDLKYTAYHIVTGFGTEEIGRVQEAILEAKAGNAFDRTDERFIGFFDASQEDGWTLGVVDTQEHTVTKISHQYNYPGLHY